VAASSIIRAAASSGSVLRSARLSTKAPFEAVDEADDQPASDVLRQAAAFNAECSAVNPAVEHLSGRPPQCLVGTGHLQSDGGDRATLDEIRPHEGIGGGGEGHLDRGEQVGTAIENGQHMGAVLRAPGPDGLAGQLRLAT